MTAMSSTGLRLLAVTEGIGSRTVTVSACSPRLPSTMPNSTRLPGFSAGTPAGSADWWTKTSPPSSRDRKPKPFSASYHFTLPVGTRNLCSVCAGGGCVRRTSPTRVVQPNRRRAGLRDSCSAVGLGVGQQVVHRPGPERLDRHGLEPGSHDGGSDPGLGGDGIHQPGVDLQPGGVTQVTDPQVAH